MMKSIADELYSEILNRSNGEIGTISTAGTKNGESNECDENELWHEDGSWDGFNNELDKASDLDREWQRRRDQFHTIGYRDGLMAGKEASAQEGFNIGFGESISVGYKWGLVRGVTSGLACLPDAMKKGLVESGEKRTKFLQLHESVSSLSTADALKLFHNGILLSATQKNEEGHNGGSSDNLLETYHADIRSLVLESPALEVNLKMDH